jgi:putative ABC transport system permease protein
MLKNYFLVALRNFWRNKAFSAINILGLAIGISASLVIFLIVDYDFTFDHFEKGRDRVYRLDSKIIMAGEPFLNSGVPFPVAPAIAKEIPGIEIAAPIFTAKYYLGHLSVPYPDANHPTVFKRQSDVVYADKNYFDLIGYTWLAGSPATALSQPYQTVLTESNARLYFPRLSPNEIIGRHLTFVDSVQTTITGIVKDIPLNTDFTFKTFVSYATLYTTRMQPGGWGDWTTTIGSSQLFVRLSPGITVAQLAKKLKTFDDKHFTPTPGVQMTQEIVPQPLSDLHFNADYGAFEDNRTAHKPTLYGLLAVAAFLLLLACINFINLTTAQASRRAKEIGIRKTMGSNRRQLTLQFLNETFLLTVLATALSLVIMPLLLKVFADFIPPGVHYDLLNQPQLIVFLVLLIIIVACLSGLYPALILSAYKPVSILKNQTSSASGRTRTAWFRKSLTVAQFTIAQVFIIATILVGRQISYALNKDLGFRKNAVIYLWAGAEKKDIFHQQLAAIPGIAMISRATNPPSTSSTWSAELKYKDGKKEVQTEVQYKLVDTNYLRLYQFRLLAGNNLAQSDTTNATLINETYAHLLGFRSPRDAVGHNIEWHKKTVPIVGVIADFHQLSLHDPIKPLALANGTKGAINFNIALQPQNTAGTAWSATIAQIERIYHTLYPNNDFVYYFQDETIAKYYTAEKNISRLLMWATGLAIFISALGLLGLVIYITNQRTKEVGIRKVIGASVAQIVFLLSRDFLALVLLAILIALPITWWAGHEWLKNFAYRAAFSWWIFASGCGALLIVALAVLGVRTYYAAIANPVESLHSE